MGTELDITKIRTVGCPCVLIFNGEKGETMRITQIRTRTDAGWWVIDQLAHGLIGYVPVSWYVSSIRDAAITSAVILAVREVEQGRETWKEWRTARKWFTPMPDNDAGDWPTVWNLITALHLPDRFGDIICGALFSVLFYVIVELIR